MSESAESIDKFGLANALKGCSTKLIELLENNSHQEAASIINNLVQSREEKIYTALGRLTRGLHNALADFKVEEKLNSKYLGYCDTSDGISSVMEMTEKSAHRTMDSVEASAPIVAEIGQQAEELLTGWEGLRQRDPSKEELQDVFLDAEKFMHYLRHTSVQLSKNMQNIVVEQGVQELSGQVLKRVTTLVHDLEDKLLSLLNLASHAGLAAGIYTPSDRKSYIHSLLKKSPQGHSNQTASGESSTLAKEKNSETALQVNAAKKPDLLFSQDDVDGLLSSLGF